MYPGISSNPTKKRRRINQDSRDEGITRAMIKILYPFQTKIHSPCLPIFSQHCAPSIKCHKKIYQKWWFCTTIQSRGPRIGKAYQLFIHDIYKYLMLLLFCRPHKTTDLLRHTLIQGSLTLKKNYLILKYNFGCLPLDTMSIYPFFNIILLTITSM